LNLGMTKPNLRTWARGLRSAAEAARCSDPECDAKAWERWTRKGSGIDCNGHWFCREVCWQRAIERLVGGVEQTQTITSRRAHRLPLGLMMLARGAIDESQLKRALAWQNHHPAFKVGQCLVHLGATSAMEVTRALGAQHCLPVLLSDREVEDGGIPLALMEECWCAGFQPIVGGGHLYLGFDGVVDRSLLTAAEVILGRTCEPCIVTPEFIARRIAAARRLAASEIVFDTSSSTGEIARIVGSYIGRMVVARVRIATTKTHIWVNLAGSRRMNVLFRLRDSLKSNAFPADDSLATRKFV